MLLQKQPNRWSCLPTAFAMLLDVKVEEIFKFIGHDGSEIIWPNVNTRFRRRAFHPQELYHYCISRGYWVMPMSPRLASCPPGLEVTPLVMDDQRFGDMINYHHGVITGRTVQGNPHAVAYYNRKYYDPTTGQAMYDPFYIDTYHVMYPMGRW